MFVLTIDRKVDTVGQVLAQRQLMISKAALPDI
jgi:hypothetical protein